MPTKTTVILISCLIMLSFSKAFSAEINAVLDWSDKRRMGTTVSGKITKVVARPGMVVDKDSTLLELDQRIFSMNLERTRAAMKSSKLLLEEAQREQGRAIELYDRTVLSNSDRQMADIQLAAAQANYSQARADYEKAKLDQEYSQLTAPYHAMVIGLNAATGEVVVNENQSQVLVEIARADEMLAVTPVTGEQLASLEIDQSVEVAFRGKWLKGSIFSMTPLTGEESNNLYQLSVRFSVDPKSNARAGEPSAIRLPE